MDDVIQRSETYYTYMVPSFLKLLYEYRIVTELNFQFVTVELLRDI